jgi:hypothetical protein
MGGTQTPTPSATAQRHERTFSPLALALPHQSANDRVTAEDLGICCQLQSLAVATHAEIPRLAETGLMRVLLSRPAHCRGEWSPSTTHSAIMASSVPGKLMVVEWTEDAVELHEVGFEGTRSRDGFSHHRPRTERAVSVAMVKERLVPGSTWQFSDVLATVHSARRSTSRQP